MPFVIKGMENGWIMSATGMDARRRKEDPLDEDGLAAFQIFITNSAVRIIDLGSETEEASPIERWKQIFFTSDSNRHDSLFALDH